MNMAANGRRIEGLNKYELQIATLNRVYTIELHRPNLDFIINYIENLVGENNEYTINYIKEIT